MSHHGKSVPTKKPARVAAPKGCDGLPNGVPDSEELTAIPGGVTHYFPIALGGKTGAPDGCPVTGVFIPRGFEYTANIDLVLFFHGDKQGWTTIYDYWKPGNVNDITLRQAVNDSGKNVILVAPTMGSNPGWSGDMTGDLDTDSADRLLDDVWTSLAEADPKFKSTWPHVGKVALAAHSGGGETLLMQTMLMKKYASNIRAVWGFDCTYNWKTIRNLGTGSNAGNVIRFASYRMDVELHFHYQKGSSKNPKTDTETVGAAIDKVASAGAPFPGTTQTLDRPLRNVHVWPSSDGHYAQLNNNFPDRMTARTGKFPP